MNVNPDCERSHFIPSEVAELKALARELAQDIFDIHYLASPSAGGNVNWLRDLRERIKVAKARAMGVVE